MGPRWIGSSSCKMKYYLDNKGMDIVKDSKRDHQINTT